MHVRTISLCFLFSFSKKKAMTVTQTNVNQLEVKMIITCTTILTLTCEHSSVIQTHHPIHLFRLDVILLKDCFAREKKI